MISPKEKSALSGFLQDDAVSKDVTSAITQHFHAEASIKCNEECLISGLEEAAFLFRSRKMKVRVLAKNGEKIRKGKVVLRIYGSNRKILSIERVALNVLGKMSGVATLCGAASSIAKGKTKIYLTRKTTPGFSVFEKKACVDGGVMPHRKNLADGVLLKENHLIFFGSIADAINAAKSRYKNKKIEIEAENGKEALEAANEGADIILLDNFSPKKARDSIKKVKKIRKGIVIELSGGIGLKNLRKYVNLGAERISIGQLTKEAKIIDFSLDVKKVKK